MAIAVFRTLRRDVLTMVVEAMTFSRLVAGLGFLIFATTSFFPFLSYALIPSLPREFGTYTENKSSGVVVYMNTITARYSETVKCDNSCIEISMGVLCNPGHDKTDFCGDFWTYCSEDATPDKKCKLYDVLYEFVGDVDALNTRRAPVLTKALFSKGFYSRGVRDGVYRLVGYVTPTAQFGATNITKLSPFELIWPGLPPFSSNAKESFATMDSKSKEIRFRFRRHGVWKEVAAPLLEEPWGG